MSPEEQRRVKLETGTNYPPRTPTEKPFDIGRKGYMFFQGPTPKTAVQEDLPAFLSRDDLKDAKVPTTLKVVGGVGSVSLLAVLFVLLTA